MNWERFAWFPTALGYALKKWALICSFVYKQKALLFTFIFLIMSARLFSDFNAADKDAWEKQAEKELKGKLQTLSDWTIGSELHLEPYHTSADIDADHAAAMQACQKSIPGWKNMPELTFSEPLKTNADMKDALENGADAVILSLGKTSIKAYEFTKSLHGIKLSDTPVYFRTAESGLDLFREISKNAGYYLKGGIAFDPIANWMRTGEPVENHIHGIVSVLNESKNMRAFRPFMIEGHIYHNNGADQVQELSFMLAATVECLDLLTNEGVSPLVAFNRIFFSVSIGPEYLTEIAKLRALRYLLSKISDAYQLPAELCTPFIHAQTSTFYNANVAPYTNMIRSASEAMSGVVGGCDALTVVPYDNDLAEPNKFSARIARNVSLLLNHESAFGNVADPAAGSYMLETMSLKLADQAWEMFLNIEQQGGFMKSVESGFIGKELKKSLEQKVSDLNQKKVMVGVNKFAEGSPQIENVQFSDRDGINRISTFADKNLTQCYQNSISNTVRL